MRGLRMRMVMIAVLATFGALLLVWALVEPALRERSRNQIQDMLLAEARLMARVVSEPLAHGAGTGLLDPLVDEAARDVRARVTIIGIDGRVLADSSVSGADLAGLENHGSRPEVRQALASGIGTAIRRSTTVGEELLYVAVVLRKGDRLLGVSRVARSIEGIRTQTAELSWALTAALGIAFLLATALTAVLSPALVGPLQETMATAREFAAGNLAARIRVRRRDELGELARILNQAADQLQARLFESARDRARTDTMLAALESGVLAVDHKGGVLLANASLCRWFELRDPVGQHYLEVLRQPEISSAIEEVLRGGDRHSAEVELQGRVFAFSAATFPGEAGEPRGAIVTFDDVTRRHRLDQIRRDFVANASHELRTPLTSIRGFVEALEDGALEDPQKAARFLGKIRTHADRMTTLVEDLLELSRLEAGARVAQREEVSLEDIVEEVSVAFASVAGRKNIALAAPLQEDLPSVVTDPERLRRILDNLVDNALKYTPEGGRVEICTRQGDDGAVVIEVRDNGPGIAEEDLPRIFERFYRVDKARSRELGGTGLGLSIVRHLAESIGATVGVTSRADHGSCFTVSLPSTASV